MSTPGAMVMGCERDFSPYGESEPPNPFTTMRSCGGHIHVGYDDIKYDRQKLIKAMDIFLGLPASIMDPLWERRATMYGGFGKYREKPYGLEYRALSNFWLQSTTLMEWAWNNTIRAIENMEQVKADGDTCFNDIDYLINKYDLEIISDTSVSKRISA